MFVVVFVWNQRFVPQLKSLQVVLLFHSGSSKPVILHPTLHCCLNNFKEDRYIDTFL